MFLICKFATAAPAPGLPGIYQGTLPDEGRTLYMSLRITENTAQPPGGLKGAFTVGTGPDFAHIDFPSLTLDSDAKQFSGIGHGTFHGRKLEMSLACGIKDDATLACISAYPHMNPASFTLHKGFD
jgi:hypothetical protein